MTEPSPPNAPPTPPSFLAGLLRDWGLALAVVVLVFAGYNLLFAPKPPALGPAEDFTLQTPAGEARLEALSEARVELAGQQLEVSVVKGTAQVRP